MRNIGIVFVIILVFTACGKLERQMHGNWIVTQAYYHNEPVIWDLYHHCMDLREDNKCDLPPINDFKNRTEEEQIGVWRLVNKDNKAYLQIETENWIFNRTFEIHNLRKVQDTVNWGYLMKMTLTSDSLKLDCTRVLY